MTINDLLQSYRTGRTTPRALLADLLQRLRTDADQAIFIHLLTDSEIEPYLAALDGRDPSSLPLFGVPFAIKDNIDLARIPTTAACAEFAYTPEHSATVVQRLLEAGAIPLGKTNLDQFATGLVGVRSPYGVPVNPFHPDYIPGGSSSGSAVAVSRGFAAFSLGTDTAGSGRVPGIRLHPGAQCQRGAAAARSGRDPVGKDESGSICHRPGGRALTLWRAGESIPP